METGAGTVVALIVCPQSSESTEWSVEIDWSEPSHQQ